MDCEARASPPAPLPQTPEFDHFFPSRPINRGKAPIAPTHRRQLSADCVTFLDPCDSDFEPITSAPLTSHSETIPIFGNNGFAIQSLGGFPAFTLGQPNGQALVQGQTSLDVGRFRIARRPRAVGSPPIGVPDFC
jgi:hypothetical protein